jgi:hypothetical protein
VIPLAALTASMNRSGATADLGLGGPPAARTTQPAGGDRSAVVSSGARTVRSWRLLVLAAPAAAEVWSGWVGIAQKTGFGLVSPLPGILPSLHLDTSITLPVGVEAYAAYALRAWLADGNSVSDRTRRFAKWSAICSFALAWPDRWPTTCWPRPVRHGHRGRSPRSCPAYRSWSWPWGPRSPTCSAPMPTPQRTHRTMGPEDQQYRGPQLGPPRTRQGRPRTGPHRRRP